ncbi:MAG: hypothetical protein HQL02_00240 [Nitrospirae bacterium]|nr:hypothetical protein [Nitrospirota bacterium]
MADNIYLETTALIDHVLKGWYPELSAIIRKAACISTSQYSKMEIRKGFLYYWIMLYNRTAKFESYTDVIQLIANLSRSPKRYYLGACIDADLDFWKNYVDRNENISSKREILLGLFRSNLRTQIRLCFHKIAKRVDATCNPMQCFKDLSAPVLEDEMFIKKLKNCNESRDKCNIAQYIRDNKDDFEKILNKLEGLEEKDSETKRRISSLRKILKMIKNNEPFSNHDQNQDLCWDCGDAIHAVISPDDSTLLTRNVRHLEPICESIGKKFKGYSSPKIGS